MFDPKWKAISSYENVLFGEDVNNEVLEQIAEDQKAIYKHDRPNENRCLLIIDDSGTELKRKNLQYWFSKFTTMFRHWGGDLIWSCHALTYMEGAQIQNILQFAIWDLNRKALRKLVHDTATARVDEDALFKLIKENTMTPHSCVFIDYTKAPDETMVYSQYLFDSGATNNPNNAEFFTPRNPFVARFRLFSCVIPLTVYTTAKQNDTLAIVENGVKRLVTVPPGNYNSSTFPAQLKNALGGSYLVFFDENQRNIRIENPNVTFSILGLDKVEMSDNEQTTSAPDAPVKAASSYPKKGTMTDQRKQNLARARAQRKINLELKKYSKDKRTAAEMRAEEEIQRRAEELAAKKAEDLLAKRQLDAELEELRQWKKMQAEQQKGSGKGKKADAHQESIKKKKNPAKKVKPPPSDSETSEEEDDEPAPRRGRGSGRQQHSSSSSYPSNFGIDFSLLAGLVD
ncbi:hypothetical protein HK097_010191 [Rhizophlyctis rosea]|uniref:Uncharacterized protein n=1 Tax=Rhizophlyctis rosea TaxID=64517 RepID=A0AAD5X0M1_9FUNG|nr:hypothetical protein HK097_010191 [Rhizophlyctis rosea]